MTAEEKKRLDEIHARWGPALAALAKGPDGSEPTPYADENPNRTRPLPKCTSCGKILLRCQCESTEIKK